MGTKNLLDHLKRCLPVRTSTARDLSDSTIEVRLRAPVVVVVVVAAAAAAAAAARAAASVVRSSKVSQRPCFKTLDNYVTRSGKKVREGTRKVIHEKTATLVAAAAHLPYR